MLTTPPKSEETLRNEERTTINEEVQVQESAVQDVSESDGAVVEDTMAD